MLVKRGILHKAAQKSLSAINLNLFTPCLIFSKLASSLNLSVLPNLWAMPAFFVLVSSLGWIIATVGSRAWGIGKRLEQFVISCVIFQNVRMI